MSTTTTRKVANATQLRAFNKGLNIAASANPKLWQVDESTAIWVKAQIAQTSSDKNPYLKPTVADHGFFYGTANAEDFEYIHTLAEQLEVDPDTPATVFVKIAKQTPIDMDESIVEARYSDNPTAIANWKQALAEDQQRLVALVIEE